MDKILNHIEKIDSDVKRMTKKGFWRRVFSGKKSRFLSLEKIFLGSLFLFVLPVFAVYSLELLGFKVIDAMSNSNFLGMGLATWWVGVILTGIVLITAHDRYLRPHDKCGKMASSLSDLNDVLQKEKMDKKYIKKVVDNMPHLSLEWWNKMSEILDWHRISQGRESNKQKIDSIKNMVKHDDGLLIEINVKQMEKSE